MGDFIVIAVLAVLIGLVILSLIKRKKNHSSCGCGCALCEKKDLCNKQKTE